MPIPEMMTRLYVWIASHKSISTRFAIAILRASVRYNIIKQLFMLQPHLGHVWEFITSGILRSSALLKCKWQLRNGKLSLSYAEVSETKSVIKSSVYLRTSLKRLSVVKMYFKMCGKLTLQLQWNKTLGYLKTLAGFPVKMIWKTRIWLQVGLTENVFASC